MLEESAIFLDPDFAAPEFVSTGAEHENFSVAATFDNPVSGSFRQFSYGVKFRESEGVYQAISINSEGELRYLEGTPSEEAGQPDTFTVVTTFDYDGIDTAGAGSTTVHLTVYEDQAWLFVNDEFISQFTVGGMGNASEIQFIGELENETQISGAQIAVTGLEVRSGELASSLDSFTMIKESGEITRTEQTGTTRDFVIDAEFVSGYERILGKWSVGFEFVKPATGETHWVVINNSRQWKHYRQAAPGGEIEEVVGAIHNGILRDRGDINRIQVVGQNGVQQLFINGVFIYSLALQPEQLPVQITAISGFADTDQQTGFPTEIRNYAVWSFGN